MSHTIHVALGRVYRSRSSYGAVPFTAPQGSPRVLQIGDETLELHLGNAPKWLRRAHGRVPIFGGALLRGMFHNAPTERAALDEHLTAAPLAELAHDKDAWLCTFILRKQVQWQDAEVTDAPWIWWTDIKRALETEQEMKLRAPSLDLIVRAVSHFIPNVLEQLAVADRVYIARSPEFDDAFVMPEFGTGQANASAQCQIEHVESVLASPEFERVLINSITAPAYPADPTRPDRFQKALTSDLYADEAGSYGHYELLRQMQPVLMRASPAQPLAVMFIDMNGLKSINDNLGHDAGDSAIAEFRNAVRAEHSGMLFRTGGDEFVVFALDSAEASVSLAGRLLTAIGAREVGGRRLSASIGIVLAGDSLELPGQVRARADKEMYRAKEAGRAKDPRPCTLAVEGREVAFFE